MSLFEQFGNGPQQMNPQEAMKQLQANPAAVLRQRGISVPEGMTNPQQILNHLLQSGQLTNPRLQALGQLAMNLFKR